MLELLAPAGSMESLVAAVQNGADAVYMGYGAFNARRNAKNFSEEEFAAAVSYCHERDTKVFLTMNTLVTDRELPAAAEVASHASQLGVDAVLVQDLGMMRAVKQVAPNLPIHASTQMTVHNLDGVRQCADWGMTRAVLSREVSRDQIALICAHSPIEIEVFVHGALCMCYSGQCFFSSVIGGRSGNRGLCAQPCRLQYGWESKANGYPLSLKDLSLAQYMNELEGIGVTCVKLEGRMKRPEYVAIVTRIFSALIREGRAPFPEELEQLNAAFSRQGFTEGYYTDRIDKSMFGVRTESVEPKELFAAARLTYQKGENPRVPITMEAVVCPDTPVYVAAKDDKGHFATAEGKVPEVARNRAITPEVVQEQLGRTGGTPYRCESVDAQVTDGLSLPLSALNALRREVLEDLSAQRTAPPTRAVGAYTPTQKVKNDTTPPKWTVCFRKANQVTKELLDLNPAMVYLSIDDLLKHPELRDINPDVPFCIVLPRIRWAAERPGLMKRIEILKAQGLKHVLVSNVGQIKPMKELGFIIHGDFGLEIYNSESLAELRDLGVQSATLSFELKLAQIRDIAKCIDTEIISYGRLPLMITESCIIEHHAGECDRQKAYVLTDRKGAQFPVLSAYGCRNEIFNSQTLFLADKEKDYSTIGLRAHRLSFTTEDAQTCLQVAKRYLGHTDWMPEEYTRGLYYRDVE